MKNLYLAFDPGGPSSVSKIVCSTLLFFTLFQSLQAQCPPGSITLTTQAQVDAFAISYPGCTNLQGGLIIGPSTDIANLNGLALITEITAALTIQGNGALTDMSGLSGVSSIGTAIYITDNPVLESIDLHNVGGSLSVGNLDIINNDALASLAAPELLMVVTGRVNITGNPNLNILTGLESLNLIGGELQISNTLEDDLPDFSSLTHIGTNIIFQNNANATTINLQNVAGSLDGAGLFLITNNGSLTSLAAPEQLTSINGKLNIFGNPDLVTITGLESLVSIGGELQISNTLEDDLPDFSSLTHIGTNIIFQNNANATTINLQNVAGSLDGAGLFLITNNSSLTSLAAPEQLTSINGKLNIFGNPNLANFTGLGNLESISGELQLGNIPATDFPEMLSLNTIGTNLIISSNSSIKNLNWLANLVSIGGALRIQDNPVLNNCTINAVCDFLAGPGIRAVAGNTGCCLNEPVLTSDCGLAEFEGQTISFSSSYCFEDAGPIIGLSASKIGLTYQLKDNGGADLGDPVVGTGSPIFFGSYPNGTYQVVATAAPGCTGSISGSVSGAPGACAITAPNFCTCDAPDGRTPVSIKINAPEGQTWTVKAVIGLYDAGSPPNTLVPLAVGTPMQYLGGNMFGLDALRRTDKGYWVQLTNGSTDKDVMVGNAGW